MTRADWRREADLDDRTEVYCPCRCHHENIAELEPWCLRCDNSYANLCTEATS